jgi:hypothetical protein
MARAVWRAGLKGIRVSNLRIRCHRGHTNATEGILRKSPVVRTTNSEQSDGQDGLGKREERLKTRWNEKQSERGVRRGARSQNGSHYVTRGIMRKSKNSRAARGLLVAFGAGAVVNVYAAGNDTVEEVVVTGFRGSLTDSIEAKKSEDHVVEVISADNLGQLPNVTLAESLVRLPGINGARDRGNESLATVRGLGPRLTMGTVNGREIASSEPNRNVRWEVFPTEVVSTVKVYKTQSADLISGGVAGTIDVGTVRPLDYSGPAVVASAGASYYDEGSSIPDYSPWGDRFGASWVGKVNDNLAFALGGTYQEQKNAYPEMGSWGYTDASNSQDVNGDGVLDPTPWGAATEVKQLDQSRRGFLGAMQWRAGNFEMNVDGLYSKVNIDEKQNQT